MAGDYVASLAGVVVFVCTGRMKTSANASLGTIARLGHVRWSRYSRKTRGQNTPLEQMALRRQQGKHLQKAKSAQTDIRLQ